MRKNQKPCELDLHISACRSKALNLEMGRKRRTSMGKQKIEIKKIESEEARQVCFSKRKAGIFSKANEISTLCGAEVAVLIESSTGCPFTFGSPSVNHVADRFLHGGVDDTKTKEYEAQRLLKIQELNNKIMEANSNFEEAIRRKEMLLSRVAEFCEENEEVRRVENVEDLNLEELRKMVESLDKFKKTIRAKISNNAGTKSASSSAMTMLPELGLRVNEDDSNKGKALDINLNLFEGVSLGHLGELNPAITPKATDVGPSEPQHVPREKTVSSHTLVELDLLGGLANFATEEV